MKQQYLHHRIPPGEEREQGIENLFEELMTENFSNLVKEKVMQVQEAQRVPIKMNPKRPIPRHIMSKVAKFKDKEKNLKSRNREIISNLQGNSNKAVR